MDVYIESVHLIDVAGDARLEMLQFIYSGFAFACVYAYHRKIDEQGLASPILDGVSPP